MKKFKKSFWKASFVSQSVIGFSFIIVAAMLHFIANYSNAISQGVPFEYSIKLYSIVLGVYALLILYSLVYPCFCIEISDKEVIVKGGVFTFVQKKYKINDITWCELGSIDGSPVNYFQIHHKAGASIKYVIQMVDIDDCPEIIEELNKHKIEVVIRGQLKK